MEITSDRQAMHLAIEEAKRATGFVSPNPLVGCTIISKSGQLLATGYHTKAGEDHAEIAALKKVTDKNLLDGAKLYVTLEPCSHQGKTPPCAEALVKTPIAEVIYGLEDPNPLVSGKGFKVLRAAGKSVRSLPELQPECEELAEVFLTNMRQKRAFAALKVATSLDGKLALKNGESQWITGEASRYKAHELRGAFDAILIGAKTLAIDNPRLDIRHPRFEGKKQNAVIVLDPEGGCVNTLNDRMIAKIRNPEKVIIVVREGASVAPSKFTIVNCPTIQSGIFDLSGLLTQLLEVGICSVMVEGGAETHSEFLKQKAAAKVYQFISPVLMGEKNAVSWTKNLDIANMTERFELKGSKWEAIGQDVLMSGYL